MTKPNITTYNHCFIYLKEIVSRWPMGKEIINTYIITNIILEYEDYKYNINIYVYKNNVVYDKCRIFYVLCIYIICFLININYTMF